MSALFQHLPIHTCETFTGEHSHSEARTVFCPHVGRSRSVEDCAECPFARAVDDAVVTCVRSAGPQPQKFKVGDDPRVDIGAAAARTLLHEALSRDVVCVRSDASIAMASALIVDRNLACVPVTDAENKLIGIVSKTDLLADREEEKVSADLPPVPRGFHVEPSEARTVAEIMTPCVHALPDDAPLAFAISLMAFEDLHEVPVVDREGHVMGVVTALDMTRWLAERMGYVLARAKAPPASVTRIAGETEKARHCR